MRAIILAAGRGERMRPLTDTRPKALLSAGGRSLIEWQITRLVDAGFRELVVNVAHLGEQIEARLGNGAQLGASIEYSHELSALETAGGIANALSLLGTGPFLAVNADVYCTYDLTRLRPVLASLSERTPKWLAHLVLVDNPEHHPQGDFVLAEDGAVQASAAPRLTFSGIGVYHPEAFRTIAPGSKSALGPLLRQLADAQKLHGEHFRGTWLDVGTPERLARLRKMLEGDDAPV